MYRYFSINEVKENYSPEKIQSQLYRTSPRKRYVISLKLGLLGNNEHTSRQLSEKMGISVSRIDQLFWDGFRDIYRKIYKEAVDKLGKDER